MLGSNLKGQKFISLFKIIADDRQRNFSTVKNENVLIISPISKHSKRPFVLDALIDELQAIYDEATMKTDIDVVVLFIPSMKTIDAGCYASYYSGLTQDDRRSHIKKVNRFFKFIEDNKMITIAVINGNCIGPMLALALACSYRFVIPTPSTYFAFADFMRTGLYPAYGAIVRFAKLCSAESTLEYMKKNENITAQKAFDIGLVDHLENFNSHYKEKKLIKFIFKIKDILIAEEIKIWRSIIHKGKISGYHLYPHTWQKLKMEYTPKVHSGIRSMTMNAAINLIGDLIFAKVDSAVEHLDMQIACVATTAFKEMRNVVNEFISFNSINHYGSTVGKKIVFIGWSLAVIIFAAKIVATDVQVTFIIENTSQARNLFIECVRKSKNNGLLEFNDEYLNNIDFYEQLDNFVDLSTYAAIIIVSSTCIDSILKLCETIENSTKGMIGICYFENFHYLKSSNDFLRERLDLFELHFWPPTSKISVVEIVALSGKYHGARVFWDIFDVKDTYLIMSNNALKFRGNFFAHLVLALAIEVCNQFTQGYCQNCKMIDEAAARSGLKASVISILDYHGLDNIYHFAEVLKELEGIDVIKDLALIEQLISNGKTGIQTSAGFRNYYNKIEDSAEFNSVVEILRVLDAENDSLKLKRNEISQEAIDFRFMLILAQAALFCEKRLGISSDKLVRYDTAAKIAFGIPLEHVGLFRFFDELVHISEKG